MCQTVDPVQQPPPPQLLVQQAQHPAASQWSWTLPMMGRIQILPQMIPYSLTGKAASHFAGTITHQPNTSDIMGHPVPMQRHVHARQQK